MNDKYNYVGNFSEGLARVRMDEIWHVIDKEDNIVMCV